VELALEMWRTEADGQPVDLQFHDLRRCASRAR
jgi:hypothetical protein